MSKRENRLRREKTARRNQIILVMAVVVLAVGVISYIVYQNNQAALAVTPTWEPVALVGIEKQAWPLADGKNMGSAGAKVVVQVFSDFQCPLCGEFARGTEKQLIEQYVNSGQVRLEYRHYIVVDDIVRYSTGRVSTESRHAAEASECANAQGQFWNYHDILFANQHGEGEGAFTDDRLRGLAELLGLDLSKFDACFNASTYASAVESDQRAGEALKVPGTPTVFVNGQSVESANDFPTLQAAIEVALAAAP